MQNKVSFSQTVGRFFKNLFTKNIPIKIISILFAFLLWGYVLTIENPEYTKIVRDVPISMTGESSLTEKGLMLVSRDIGETDVTVLCQISKHSELDASRVTCTVNLSDSSIRLAEDEDSKVFPLTVTTTIRTGYGTVTAVENSTVNVEIARVSTRTGVPVSIEYNGTLPDGFRIEAPEKLSISVKGKKSLVNQIVKGVVTIDLDALPAEDLNSLAGEYSGVYSIRFYDTGNNALDDIYDESGDSYSIEVPLKVYAYREVEVRADISVEEGYDCRYSIFPKSVMLTGDRESLLAVDYVMTEPITALPGMSGTEMEVALVLPEGLSVTSDRSENVTVTMTMEEQTDTRTYTVPINVTGLAYGLVRGDDFPTETEIVVSGTLQKLERFSSAYATVTLNLSGYNAGTHTVPLILRLDERVKDLAVQLAEDTVNVTILSHEEEAAGTAEQAE